MELKQQLFAIVGEELHGGGKRAALADGMIVEVPEIRRAVECAASGVAEAAGQDRGLHGAVFGGGVVQAIDEHVFLEQARFGAGRPSARWRGFPPRAGLRRRRR